jgi:hypothetical protein
VNSLPHQHRSYYSTHYSQEEQEAFALEKPLYSRRQPLWHVAALNVLTLYGYSLVWFYKNWKQLASFAKALPLQETGYITLDEQKTFDSLRKMHLWLNTLGLMLPYVQIYFATIFFKQVAQLSPKRKFSPLTTALLLSISMMLLIALHDLPGLFSMLFVLAACPLVVAQNMLNAYWQSVEPSDLLVRQAFSAGELMFMIIGSIVMGLTLTGIVMNM